MRRPCCPRKTKVEMETVEVMLDGYEAPLQFLLTPEEAHKARTDFKYLEGLVKAEISRRKCAPKETCDGKDTCVTGKEQEKNLQWRQEHTLFLLETYREKEELFSSGRVRHSKVWEDISKVVRETCALEVTGKQCQTKISGLKRTYGEIKAKKAKSGNGAITWPYMEVMDSIFSKKAWVQPPSTASSDGPMPPPVGSPNGGISKKKKVEVMMEELVGEIKKAKDRAEERMQEREVLKMERERRKQEEEVARQRRHEERQALQREMLAVLKDIAKK